MKPSLRSRTVAALAVLVVASGCGGDSGGDGGGDGDFAKQSGNKIADAAKADMKDLDQVHYSGEITSEGSSIKLDIEASSTGDCTGSIGIGDGTAELLAKDGVNWFRPDEAFWRAQAPDQADAIIAAVGDKWVLDTDASFAQFCDLDAFFDNIFSADGGSKSDYKTVGTDTIDGQDVVKVEKSDEQGPAIGYVLIEGKHYLLKIERTDGADAGTLEFSDFNESFEVEAPAEGEVVDLSQL
jgi:hypothetical protein